MPKVIKGGPSHPTERSSPAIRPDGAQHARPRPAPAPPGPDARPKKRIIEREVVGATHEARRIVQEAESQAQRILDEAREQAAETHQRGFEEGRQEGLAQFTQQITQALLRIHQIEAGLEAEYVGLVRSCVEKILDQELRQSPDAIVAVVRSALRDARQQREVIVRIHPDDVELVRRQQARLLEVLARAPAIEVRPDPGITRGGCVVSTELGLIDATLERQLDALVAAIEAELGEGGGAAPFENDSELDSEDDPGFS